MICLKINQAVYEQLEFCLEKKQKKKKKKKKKKPKKNKTNKQTNFFIFIYLASKLRSSSSLSLIIERAKFKNNNVLAKKFVNTMA